MIRVGAAALALALALRAPLSLTVLGLLLFGALHNVPEIRYVTGRFATRLTGRFLLLLLALTSGIALCRLTSQLWPVGARYAEVTIGYLILAAGSGSGYAACRWRPGSACWLSRRARRCPIRRTTS